MTGTRAAQLLRTTWRSMQAIVERVVADLAGKSDRLAGLARIGIDEISYRKGQRFLMIVVDHDSGRLAWAAEGRHLTELLKPMDLDGAVVTFDALHTVRANLNWLADRKKAHYIAVVKKNQPLLHARVKALPWRQIPAGSSTRDTGHGRIETRTCSRAPARSSPCSPAAAYARHCPDDDNKA
jgi:Transposase